MTVHVEMAEAGAAAFLKAGGGRLFGELEEALSVGAFPREFTAAFGDWSWTGKTMGQIWAFMRIDGLVRHGHAALFRVQLPHGPALDRMRDVNAAALAEVPPPFSAYLNMHQNNADADGHFKWSDAIPVTRYPGGNGDDMSAAPAQVPLEVGSCSPSRILVHLMQAGGVARWPYGWDELLVLVGLPSTWGLMASLRDGSCRNAIGDPIVQPA